MAGVEGTFDELLIKARFEEAKIRDLAITSVTNRAPRMQTRPGSQAPEHSRGIPRVPVDPASSRKEKKELNLHCFLCNGVGHYRRGCPLKNRDVPVEARGRQPT